MRLFKSPSILDFQLGDLKTDSLFSGVVRGCYRYLLVAGNERNKLSMARHGGFSITI